MNGSRLGSAAEDEYMDMFCGICYNDYEFCI